MGPALEADSDLYPNGAPSPPIWQSFNRVHRFCKPRELPGYLELQYQYFEMFHDVSNGLEIRIAVCYTTIESTSVVDRSVP